MAGFFSKTMPVMIMFIKKLSILLLLIGAYAVRGGVAFAQESATAPRVVNVINFIRQTEPRFEAITDEVLYQTVVEQVKLLNRYHIKGTFLLQYDALISPKYRQLLKNEVMDGTEIGGWWEITQPHVEAAGLVWRGRYSWDWHANVGFSTGYTPEEREKLVDVYMAKFKEVFGRYPTAIGSWFIDAHTLAYMYDKYHIVASCNCRDQIGTDGYTLWGGYWHGGYYPSRKNAYMPAQTREGQIPIPVFRMLGSDPIYQYDSGIGGNYQGVVTLEPVYGDAGGSEAWVKWFFQSMFKDPAMTMSYVQVGQENSFTWEAMKNGLEMQISMLSQLQKDNAIRIETLSETGRWYSRNYSTTAPSAISALTDYKGTGKKTVWYNSKYYRANLFWEGDKFRFRDIHLFNENLASDYIDKPGTTSTCVYTTLPFVDGNVWSSESFLSGLRLFYIEESGQPVEAEGESPEITHDEERLCVKWPLKIANACFIMTFEEDRVVMECENIPASRWYLELSARVGAELPFIKIAGTCVDARVKDFDYSVSCKGGDFVACNDDEGRVFKVVPRDEKISLIFRSGK